MAEWTPPASNSLIIIDKQITDWQSIFDSMPHDSDIVFIEQGEDGLNVLSQALIDRSNLDAVHIFSHGQSGRVQLGSGWLDSTNLGNYPVLVQAFANAIKDDGDILLYGCDVALSDKGENFVRELAHLTGADVAASVNLTGADGLAADWVLEHSVGTVDALSYEVEGFSGTLALPADGSYTFAGATKSGSVFVTKDGFFEIAAYDGNGQDSPVNADQYGAYIQEGTTTGGPFTSYIEVRVAGGGSFQVSSASILDYADGSGSHDFYNIYAVGLADGKAVATTAAVSSVGILHDVSYPINYAPFNGVYIDTFRVYYTWSTGTAQEDFNLESISIKNASNEPPPPALNAPSLTATSTSPTFTEGGSAVDLFSSVTAATNDSGQTFSGLTLTVTNVSNGSSEVLGIGGTDISLVNGNSGSISSGGTYSVSVTSGTATITLTGMTRSDAQMGTLIDGITYSNASDAPGTSNRVVTITGITDSGSSSNTASPNKTSTVTVVAVNDAPTASNLTQSLSQNLSTSVRALNDIVVSDADGTDTITATLTLANKAAGTLSTGTFGSATSTYNSGTGVWTVSGSITDVNAALAAVAFTRDSAWSQSVSITTRIRDAGNTGPADGTITINQTDDIAPTVTSIVRQTPSTQYTNASELTWRVTFSEAVENLDTTDFFISSGSTSSQIVPRKVVSAGTNAYDVTMSEEGLADWQTVITNGNTDAVLNFADSHNITDAEGNALSATTPTGTNETQYIVDNIAPTFNAPASTPADNGLLANLSSDLSLQFNDAKTILNTASGIKAGKGQLTLRNLTTDEVVETFDVQSSGSLTFKDSTVTINPSKDLLSGSRYAVQIESGAITDLAGNAFAGISNNTDFNFETVPQVVLSVDNTSIKEAGGVATVTATLKDSAGNTITAPDTVTVTLKSSGTASSAVDYDLSSTTITISKGDSTGTLTVTGRSDDNSDNGETVILDIDSVTNGLEVTEQQVTITLSENSVPVVDLNGAEGSGTNFSTSFTEDGNPVVIVKTEVGQEAFVSDSDGDNIQSMTVTLTNRPDGDSNESLGLNAAATTAASGLTVSYTQSTGVLSISGTASTAVYQSVLRGVTYNNTSQSPDTTSRTINVVVNDGNVDSSTAVSTISIVNVNDAPVLDTKASPALTGISEDLAAPASSSTANSTLVSSLLSGVSDVDTSAVQGLAVTAVNTSQGTLWFSTDAGASWTSVDKTSDSNALLLRSTDRVYWQPAANKNGTIDDAFSFRAWDRTATGVEGDYVDTSTNGGTTAFSTASDTVAVTVTAVNDAPTLTGTSKALDGVNEDTTTKASKVSDLLVDLGYTDIESDVGGVAITGAEGAGEWQYSTDGSHWFDVDTVNSSASLLLNADALIRYQPDGKNGESNALLSLRAWDQTSGSASSGSTRGTADSNSSGGSSAFSTQQASITVAVTSVNDAPTIDNSATYTMAGITENQTSAVVTVSTILSDAKWADVDSGAVSGVAITATVGNGTWQYSSDTGKTWSAVSSVSDSSALLLSSDVQLRYVGDSKRGETATLSYRAWDQSSGTAGSKTDASTQGGTTAFSSNSSAVSIAVSNINERPVLDTKASPALTTIAEDSAAPQNGSTTGSTTVSSLLAGASDGDGDTSGIAITAVNEGTIWFSIDTGKTWTAASNLSAQNALLLEGDHLIYFQPTASKEGTISNALIFHVWDTTGAEGAGEYWDPTEDSSATSPYSAETDTVSVSITAVNDAPTITANDTHVLTATTEDATSTTTLVSAILSGVEQADVDTGALSGMAITAVTGNGTWQFSADAGANWNNFPTVSASAALLLAADSQVRYVPDAKNSETTSLSFRAWDQTSGTASATGSIQTADTSTNGGSSAFSAQSASATLQVTAVNDAPVLDPTASPALTGISEDLAAPASSSTANSTLVSSLLSGVSDVDTSALQGLAVTAVNTSQGTLWFSTDAGASWTSVDKASDSNALLLRSTDHVYWQPAANKNGTIDDAFSFRAWDRTATGVEGDYVDTSTNGGTTAFSTASDTVAVTVTAVNDAPTLTTTSKALGAVNEDSATTGTKVSGLLSDLGYADIESDVGGVAITGAEGAGEWQYSTDGSNWFDVDTVSSSASLLLGADALLRYQPDGKNGENNARLDLRAWDQTSGSASSGSTRGTADSNSTGGSSAFSTQLASMTVDVSSVNDAPTINNGATYTMASITEDDTSSAITISTILSDSKWSDVDTGALSGVAITAVNGKGGWEYSSDTGKTWSAISSVSDSSALLLTSTSQLRYVGDGKQGETATLSYRAWDQTSGTVGSKADASTHGGSTAFSSNSSEVSIFLSDVNDNVTGTVTIEGAAEIGNTLRISNNLADVDGLGTFTYIWKANDAVIDGATKSTFLVPESLVNKTITVTIEYTDKGGTKESMTSKATATVVEPVAGTNIDGALVSETTEIGSNGSTVTVTDIAIVTEGRQEQVGESSLANVPVVTQNGQTMLEVGLPSGTGMRVETETSIASGDTDPNGVTGLIAAIRARTNTPDAQKDQQDMTGVGGGFLGDLPNKGADLIVRTLIPVVGAGVTTPPANPIKITAPVPAGNERPVATVIDVRGLPSGTVIELDNIQFVAVVGEVTMTGGAGAQVATGDSKRQIIVLGEDDDVIRAGGGDDLVGSRGGNDRLYGDDGNDIVIGGAGDDWLEGGAGNDVLQGGGSDAGTWRFSLVDGELVSRFDAAHVIAADSATMQRVGPWWTEGSHGKETDNRLQFTYETIDRLKLVSTLYTAVVGERPELLDYNHFTGSDLSDLQLANAAVQHWFASRIMPQAIEVQVAMLIDAVWGEGAASDALIDIGTEFVTGGGSWAEALLILARAVEAEQLIRTDAGELTLVKDLVTSETGRNQGNAGNDTLLGGAGNDRLIGGGGNNFLDGGDGTDVAVYTGALGDFSFQVRELNGVKQMVLTTLHTGDVDVLQNIELLKVGGNYFQLSSAIAALPSDVDHALNNYVVELTAQQVQALDLAGIY